jgi:hypothetical protein
MPAGPKASERPLEQVLEWSPTAALVRVGHSGQIHSVRLRQRPRGKPPNRRFPIKQSALVRSGLTVSPGGHSPRPVLIIFHPSLSRLSMSALVVAVMPQATLCALHAARIV